MIISAFIDAALHWLASFFLNMLAKRRADKAVILMQDVRANLPETPAELDKVLDDGKL